jgi:predicted GTPase
MSHDLDARLAALREAAELADGRLEADDVRAARAVVARAGERLGLGLESTVAALAGPTGAGKSSLFNALAGTGVSAVGRRRPTTSAASAAVWGDVGEELLDWLEVPRRHRVQDAGLDGLVLLDLPDFDSVEASHRLEVDRVVGLADLVVWVVDPQKYADSVWHDRYLRRLAPYEETMAVVLNQADALAPAALDACAADLRALLERDGVADVPLLAVSARTGAGLEELRSLLAARVAAREAALARLSTDVDVAAATFAAACAGARARGVSKADRERLHTALSDAAGVPTVVLAVARAHRRRGALATGWPFVRWLRRFRPDPLRRLRLPERPQEGIRTSLPAPTSVQRAQVEVAARRLGAEAAEGLADPWPRLVRSAATARGEDVADRLDRAVAGAELHMRAPRWWRVAGFLQTLLAAAVAVGALWLLALLALDYLRLDDVIPVPEADGIPLPTALLVGGAAAGIALAFLARLVNGFGAGRRARAASRSLGARVEGVAEELVIGPVEEELATRDRLCAAVAAASPSGKRTSRKASRRRSRPEALRR